MGAVGVEKFHLARAQNLEAIVKVAAGCEVLRAEAGTRVVDFEEFDGLVGAIADCGLDICGVAAGGCGKRCKECEDRQETHRVKGIRTNGKASEGFRVRAKLNAEVLAGLKAKSCIPL